MATAAQTIPANLETPDNWARLIESSAWAALSPSRRVWVSALLSNGENIFEATRTAYPDATEKSSKCMAYELRKNREIMRAINFYRGGPSLEEQIADVMVTIQQAPPYERHKAQRLLAELVGLLTPNKIKTKSADSSDDEPSAQPTDTEPVDFFVGQRLTQRDKDGVLRTGEVVSINEDGTPKIKEIL